MEWSAVFAPYAAACGEAELASGFRVEGPWC